MVRNFNTNRNGANWSDDTIKIVWNKGRIIPNFSPDDWRWDKCGLVMKFAEHGNRNSEHGWEIDHINPVSNGGGDNYDNLQPLNWKNNADKSNSLNWSCPF
jgi:5-methylcytosine-specific restriction endonuclease McrA